MSVPDPHPGPFKAWLKRLAARAVRPGLAPVHERFDALQADLLALRNRLDEIDTDRDKYHSELEYWRWLIKKGGSEKGFGGPFERVFAKWTRDRFVKLGEFLGLPAPGQPGDIDDWAARHAAVEIGAGPYPLLAAAAKGWKRALAADPIARGYVEEGLVAAAADRIIYIEARGENLPLPGGSADLVVIENCLDHVRDPAAVLREIHRLLVRGGLMWIFVDLSEHIDHMHPHAMSEAKVRALLRDAGLEVLRDEVTAHKAHPQAYGSYCGLLRRPETIAEEAHATDNSAAPAHEPHAEHDASNGAVRVAVAVKPELSLNGSALGRPRN